MIGSAPLAVGLTLGEFRIATTDGEGREIFVGDDDTEAGIPSADCIHKVLALSQLSIYWLSPDENVSDDDVARGEDTAELSTRLVLPQLRRGGGLEAAFSALPPVDSAAHQHILSPCSVTVALTLNADVAAVAAKQQTQQQPELVLRASATGVELSVWQAAYQEALALSMRFKQVAESCGLISAPGQRRPFSLGYRPIAAVLDGAETGGGPRVRFHIIRNYQIENVCKSQSCMISKLRIIGVVAVRTVRPP